MNSKTRFVVSYSGGKDSVLALYRAIKLGYEPVSLLTTYNASVERSWFHGVPTELLNKVSESLKIPLELVTTGQAENYGIDFEFALTKLKDKSGANTCIFGDIDIQAHRDWCASRCDNAEIESVFPLWNGNRKELVYEFIDLGFKAVITIVNTTMLSSKYLGKTLTRELVEEIAADGADMCGENGEYHSFAYYGPLFERAIDFTFGDILINGDYSILPLFATT